MKTTRQEPRDSQIRVEAVIEIPAKAGFADQALQALVRLGNKAKTCGYTPTAFDSDVSVCR